MAVSDQQQLFFSNMIKKKKGGKGRQKIEMKKMSESSNRQVTFSKRRKTLFKNAEELVRSSPCNTRVAVFALSIKGFPHSYGNSPDAETLIDQFLATDNLGYKNDDNAPVMKLKDTIIGCGVGIEKLGLGKLEGYANILMEMRSDVEIGKKNKFDDTPVFDFKKEEETVLLQGDQDLGPLHDLQWMNEDNNLELDDFEWMNVADLMETIEGSDVENRIDNYNEIMIIDNSKVINASISLPDHVKNVETSVVHNGDSSGLLIDDSDELMTADNLGFDDAFPWINRDLGIVDDLQWKNGTDDDLRLEDDFQWINGFFQNIDNLN